MTARSTVDTRKLDPTAIIVFHQADVGEYLRDEVRITQSPSRLTQLIMILLLGNTLLILISITFFLGFIPVYFLVAILFFTSQ